MIKLTNIHLVEVVYNKDLTLNLIIQASSPAPSAPLDLIRKISSKDFEGLGLSPVQVHSVPFNSLEEEQKQEVKAMLQDAKIVAELKSQGYYIIPE